MANHEIGDIIFRNCVTCGIETEHKVIKANYIDTNAYVCTECQQKDEEPS